MEEEWKEQGRRKEANIEHPNNYFILKIVSVTSFSKTISRQGIHFPFIICILQYYNLETCLFKSRMKCGLSAFVVFLPSVSIGPSEKHPTSFGELLSPSSHSLGGDDISKCLPFSWGVTAAVRGSLCQIFPESLRCRQEVDLMASAWSWLYSLAL